MLDWENPQLLERNRYPSHHELQGFTSMQEAFKAKTNLFLNPPIFPSNEQMVSLNGTWRFLLCIGIDELEICKDFFRKDYRIEDHLWTDIVVPGCWQLQEHDVAIYTNIKYPFAINPPHVPEKNPIGNYVYEFEVDESFCLNRQVILRFDGVDSAFHVWINGTAVGFSKDSRLPAEFDITNFMMWSTDTTKRINRLCVRVYRWSDGTYLEDQDMWFLSGIQRDVSLRSFPKACSIQDFEWKCLFDTTLSTRKNDVLVNVKLIFATAEEVQCQQSVRVTLMDLHGNVVENGTAEIIPNSMRKVNYSHFSTDAVEVRAACSLQIQNPKLWTDETPSLYILCVSLHGNDAMDEVVCLQAESSFLGFRKICIDDGTVKINDQPIYFYGVNHHEHCASGGKTVDPAFMIREIQLLKQFNFNAIRLSHYPQSTFLYDLCSMYGLYVVDEANIETHGFAPNEEKLANDPNWHDAYMSRLTRMYHRDKNHVCIIFWSLGNEAGYGIVHDKMAKWIRQKDTSRLCQYEPASHRLHGIEICLGHPCQIATDVICPMYERIPDLIRRAQDNAAPPMPIILCEYSHAMGNSNGNLHKYWETFRLHRCMQGGFIWDFQDQALLLPIPDSSDHFWGYGGDTSSDPNVPHDGCFNINGLVLPDLTPHPAMYECKFLFQPFSFDLVQVESNHMENTIVHFIVENRFNFQDSTNFMLRYEYLVNGIVELSDYIADVEFSLKSLEKKHLKVSLNQRHLSRTNRITCHEVLHLFVTQKNGTLYAKANHVVAWGDLILQDNCSSDIPKSKQLTGTLAPKAIPMGNGVLIAGQNFELKFDINRGGLYSLQLQGKHTVELFSNNEAQPFGLQFWRAATDNDRGGCNTGYTALWKKFGLHKAPKTIQHHPLKWSSLNGEIQIEHSFDVVLDCSAFRDFGASDSTKDEVQDPSDMEGLTGEIIFNLMRFKESTFMISMKYPRELRSFGKILLCQYADALNLSYEVKTNGDYFITTLHKKEPVEQINAVQNGLNSSISCRVIYHILPDRRIRIEVKCTPPAHFPCLPRVGAYLALNKCLDHVSWHGLGPHENYLDRKSGAILRVHELSVQEMYFPYIRPSENGNRSNVYWCALHDSALNRLLKIQMSTLGESERIPFDFSALPYSTVQLEAADHSYELPSNSSATFVNVDFKLMGLGGDDSWTPSVHTNYLVPAKPYEFSIHLHF